MSFNKNDRVLITNSGSHLDGRVATVLGYDGSGRVRLKVNIKMPEIAPDWEHDYWATAEEHLSLTDAVTELGELAR